MGSKRTQSTRRQRARRRLKLEALEPRVVLDGQLGVEVADVAADNIAEQSGFEQFASAEEMQQFLVDSAVDQWKDVFGTKTTGWPYFPFHLDELGPVPRIASTAETGADQQIVAGSFDGTNVQVDGIDEADLVKTDGEHLYVASEARLTIVDVRDPANLAIAAQVPLDVYSGELYVSGDRLVVLSHEYSVINSTRLASFDVAILPGGEYHPTTTVSVYDIADRTAPTLLSDTTVDGNLTASRRVDDLVYLVTSNPLQLPHPQFQCAEAGDAPIDDTKPFELVVSDVLIAPPPHWPDHERQPCFYETEREYLARIEEGLLERAMPTFETIDVSGEVIASGLVTKPSDTYKPLTEDAFNTTSIVVIDLATETSGISASTSVITNYNSAVYASANNIYVASHSYGRDREPSTTFQQFSISNEAPVDLTAVGSVSGTLLSSFAMDEHDGNLRVVTSVGGGDERVNSLFVLEQSDTSLEVIGSIDEIATGESVFAVRFMGDEAFVVTFRVIDPLFTIDLNDPANPTIKGELEIPGFSNYLHPITEDLLIGLGQEDGRFWGSPQLSLFDVSDFANPARIDQFVFESASWSEAFYNHHAISYFPDSQIAVIPFQGSGNYCIGGTVNFRACDRERVGPAFWVLRIDTSSEDKSIELLGKIEHQDSHPLRSARVGDNLLTVSTNNIKVTDLLQPDSLIDELYIGKVAFDDNVRVKGHEQTAEVNVLNNDHVSDDATIVEVGDSKNCGTAEISEDGKRLLYTPPEDLGVRHDAFTYVVESDGMEYSAAVRVHIARENERGRMIRLATEDLIERYGLEDSQHEFELRSAERVEWPDSCLGVVDDGEVCAQVITPGYKIIFDYATSEIVYHTDTHQRVVLANDPVSATDPLMQIRAEVLDAHGERTTSLVVGENATLQIHADDLRADQQGVFAAYIDVMYDSSQVAELGEIAYGVGFDHGHTGSLEENGVIDEAGAFTGDAEPNQTHVFSIPFVPSSSGELRFITDAADVFPDHDSLLMGLDVPIPIKLIQFGEVVVEVLNTLHNDNDPMDTNMDGVMTPLDALLVINHLNRHGPGPVNAAAADALRTAAAESEAPHIAADVNQDGYISAIDVLWIINALEPRVFATAEGEGSDAGSGSKLTAKASSPSTIALAITRDHTITAPAAVAETKLSAIEVLEPFPSADDSNSELESRNDMGDDESYEDRFFADLAADTMTEWWLD